MTAPKRYKLVRGEPEFRDQMCVRPDGGFVRWEDYATLAARVRSLKETLTSALRFIENTESELGITLDSSKLAHAVPPDEDARAKGHAWYESVRREGEAMIDVADRLGITVAEVSSIRQGRAPIPRKEGSK